MMHFLGFLRLLAQGIFKNCESGLEFAVFELQRVDKRVFFLEKSEERRLFGGPFRTLEVGGGFLGLYVVDYAGPGVGSEFIHSELLNMKEKLVERLALKIHMAYENQEIKEMHFYHGENRIRLQSFHNYSI
jgi:hypothetical protein